MRELKKQFFEGDAVKVARSLLGKLLVFKGCEGIIVETEAYRDDEASHLVTRKNQGRPILESYGTTYIYLNYGMYHMLNFTTNKHGPGAVLIRAVHPTKGTKLMMRRRKTGDIMALCSGPGKLCQAFGITMKHHGHEVGDIKIYDTNITPSVISSPRIGITKATDLQWRFTIKGSEFISQAWQG